MTSTIHDRIVESIYDSALSPDNWQETVVLINEAFDSTATGFFFQSSNQQALGGYFCGLEAAELTFYAEHLADKNPWFSIPGLMKPGRILSDLSLEEIYNDRHAFTRSEMYQEWYRRLDLRHSMGGNLIDYNGNLLNFTFMRSARTGYYTEEEVARYRPVCQHLTRAIEINDRLREVEQHNTFVRETVLDQLRLGVILLDNTGKVSFINRYAQKLLDSASLLTIKSSRPHSTLPANQAKISHALQKAYHDQQSSSFSLRRKSGSPLTVSCIPSQEYRNFLGITSLQVAMMFIDPDDRNIGSDEYLIRRWKLTPLESRFCLHLLRDMTINQIAEALHLTENTARWYQKQIMHKLGVTRQNQMLSKLLHDLPTHYVIPGSSVLKDK